METTERDSDRALMARVRRGESAAFHAYVARFRPALDNAVRFLRLPDGDALVSDTLVDLALDVIEERKAVPSNLPWYLYIALRRRAWNEFRRSRNEDARFDVEMCGGCSEFTIRASQGSDDHGLVHNDESLESPTEIRLLGMLNREDRQILTWTANRVTTRQIAEWLNTTHGAVRVRLSRLRSRLRDSAAQALLQTLLP